MYSSSDVTKVPGGDALRSLNDRIPDVSRLPRMAITMELEESVSDSKLHKDSTAKKELRPTSAVSLCKSENGPETTTSAEQLKQYRSWVSNERWHELKKLADIAMRDRKVFMIKGGGFPAVRRALLERGWLEKYEAHKVRHPPTNIDPKGASRKELSKVERLILYKFMEHHSVDFLWTTKRDKYDWLLSNKEVIISRFCRSLFTTKEGLTASLTQMHWYTEPGVALTKFPRCYNIHNPDSLEEFIEDFRITACISILKWLSHSLQASGEGNLVTSHGKVPFSAIEFALNRLNEYIAFFTHKDIDDMEDQAQHIWEHEWDQFLTHHYLLVHEKAKFAEDKNSSIRQLERKAVKLLATMTKYWPQIDIDGVLNIWIVKPGAKCRGRGIQLMNNIKDIIGLINIPTALKSRYVVQKYIENPLVIYDTKFDIRQWFLITCCQPLTIWVYKDSYLRFSSQIFSLSNYHESVHLTNNAVQSKYKNNGERDKALPDENMWDCHTFKAYLRQIGKHELWDSKIYPGMKQCLIGAMLACQDSMDKRQNSFELYGADFMLTEDFTPWLIEINSSPDLAPTTSVTARLCPQCLEDVIKVVLDRRNNPEADTGTFELAYRQFIPKAPAYLGLSLCINGKKLLKSKLKQHKYEQRSTTPIVQRVPSGDVLAEDKPVPPEYSGPIITDFLSWLNPYDALPTNKDGLLLAAKDSFTVRQAITVVKSGLALKNGGKKRNSSAISSRTHRGRREKNTECKRRVVPHSCCRPEDTQSAKHVGKYRTESASKAEKPKVDRSVGNKRCYIDPIEWERETASILRSTISVQNKIANRSENIMPLRQTKSGIVSSNNRSLLEPLSSRPFANEADPIKKLSAVGRNICKLRDENRNKQKAIKFSENCTSIYAPYRVVVTPLNDETQNNKKKKE
ncbi:tubulin glycylase 3A-like isoform X1 [Cydia pomonella]|uniref:tubulin glycylase 3A-like isoform X1 n=2 Tax=Cydia pomonella TaxID=82600 RepID=UPI002ADE292F|nr:tubulin glycylase 3A-like isoform X1 [Cydia pomonella]